jgi:hypothetical protein
MTATLEQTPSARIAAIHRELKEIDVKISVLANTDSAEHDAGIKMDKLFAKKSELVAEMKRLRDGDIPEAIRERASVYVKPRKGRKPSVKTTAHMGRHCYCGKDAFNLTGIPVKRPLRVYRAQDLCHVGPEGEESRQCEVYQLFREALRTGKHPVEFVRERHLFDPSVEDREHLERECLKHCLTWLREHERTCFRGMKSFHNLMHFLRVYRSCGAGAAHEAWVSKTGGIK